MAKVEEKKVKKSTVQITNDVDENWTADIVEKVKASVETRKEQPAVIKAIYPLRGRLSPFEVLVGDERIFAGSRKEAFEKASIHNRSKGFGPEVTQIF